MPYAGWFILDVFFLTPFLRIMLEKERAEVAIGWICFEVVIGWEVVK